MKYYHLATRLLLAAALLGLAGCNEEEKVGTPDFAASASGTVFKVGEPVEFALAGNPDFIVFYSGDHHDFKKDINNSLKEIHENTGKQIEALKEKTQKSLKEL